MKKLLITSWAADEWIPHLEVVEAGEVAVRRPKFRYSVMAANGGDAGVMHRAVRDLRGERNLLQLVEISRAFADESVDGRSHPAANSLARGLERRGRFVNVRVRDNGQKLVNARPGNGPPLVAVREFEEDRTGFVVPIRVLAMRVNQQVGINGDHADRWRREFSPTKLRGTRAAILGRGTSPASLSFSRSLRAAPAP